MLEPEEARWVTLTRALTHVISPASFHSLTLIKTSIPRYEQYSVVDEGC